VKPFSPVIPARSLPAPGCSTAVAPARTLTGVPTSMTGVPGQPFGVVTSADGRWIFVSDSEGVTLLRAAADGARARMVDSVTIPGGQGLGEALTPDGRYLLVAATADTAVLDVAKLESGSPDPVAGALPSGSGAIEVVTSPDGRFVFTSLEGASAVEVSNLARALSAGFGARGVTIGRVPTGLAPVGEAVSPDGRWLYVTSEVSAGPANRGTANPGPANPGTANPGPAKTSPQSKNCPGDPDAAAGDVRVIDLRAAERDPAGAVRSVTTAGSSPVRVALMPSGAMAWVTARGSDALLGFAASRLIASKPALVADVRVGSAPVGVILVDGGRLAVVADSNRFSGNASAQWLSVVSVPNALSGKAALAGQIPAGTFPRQFALSPDGRTLYVTNFSSAQLETVSITDLAQAVAP
jgi:DNA-binding beta-propeller fold protein YncE